MKSVLVTVASAIELFTSAYSPAEPSPTHGFFSLIIFSPFFNRKNMPQVILAQISGEIDSD